MSDFVPRREPQGLKAFRLILEGQAPEAHNLTSLWKTLETEASLERALGLLKQTHPKTGKQDAWLEVRQALEKQVDALRQRRMSQWQLDARRRTLRMRLAIEGEICSLHPPAQIGILAQALLEAGVPLAMGLEKHPRPMLTLGAPLPAGIPGHSEWADAVLREAIPFALETLPEATRSFLPEGLRILEAQEVPNISSPILELCRKAHWRWTCPLDELPQVQARLKTFMDSATYQIRKTGKVGGQKQEKLVEVRDLVLEANWTANVLSLTTRLAPGEAMNLQKLLSGILEWEPSALHGLERTAVELGDDPRLAQAARYETKLHNLYEDAVLLDGGFGTDPQGEDDEDPIVIQRPRRR